MSNLKLKLWKKVKKEKFKSIDDCFKKLKKRKIILSPWIENIFKNKKNKIKYNHKDFYLYRVNVKKLGFKKATKLKLIYRELKKRNLNLVPPDVALRARFEYLDQKKGEWLRFATPFNAMIDTDGIPHLPKLGCALGKYFIETYWSYPDAIFHPHNEFIVIKNEK